MYIRRKPYAIGFAALALCASSMGTFAAENRPVDWDVAAGSPSPHIDSKSRSGRWWWPNHDKLNPGHGERMGNGGRVFGKWGRENSSSAIEAAPTPQPVLVEPVTCTAIVLNNVLFTPDSAELRPEGKAETDKVVVEMGKFPGDTVICIGHTDDTGTETYNQQLGLRRAQAVVDYMKASGVAPERVSAESNGETQPAVPNDTATNRALNRRVVFQYKMGN